MPRSQKARKKKSIQHKRPRPQINKPVGKILSVIKDIWQYSSKWIKRILGILLFLFAAWFLYPDVYIKTETSLNKYNPFDTPFSIENNCPYQIHDIKCFFIYNSVELISGGGLKEVGFGDFVKHIRRLDAKKKSYMKIGNQFHVPSSMIKTAIITIEMSYEVPILNKIFFYNIKYKTEIDSEKIYHWYPYE